MRSVDSYIIFAFDIMGLATWCSQLWWKSKQIQFDLVLQALNWVIHLRKIQFMAVCSWSQILADKGFTTSMINSWGLTLANKFARILTLYQAERPCAKPLSIAITTADYRFQLMVESPSRMTRMFPIQNEAHRGNNHRVSPIQNLLIICVIRLAHDGVFHKALDQSLHIK